MSAINTLLYAALVGLIAVAAAVVAQRVIKNKRFPLFIALFLILPVSQLLLLHSFSFESWSAYWVLGALLGLLADVLLLLYTILHEKKNAAEEELKEAQHSASLEKSYYDAALRRRDELAEIRLDWVKSLKTVANLINAGEDEQSGKAIATLTDRINETNDNKYCAIPVVNAILAEKEKICESAGIELAIELYLPPALAVSPMHLCSIFSNILDNAINACAKMQNPDKPVISLKSLIEGDYLFIKATNPSDAPKSNPKSGRRYGLAILSELAAKYGGDFQNNYRDGIFTAVVALQCIMHNA